MLVLVLAGGAVVEKEGEKIDHHLAREPYSGEKTRRAHDTTGEEASSPGPRERPQELDGWAMFATVRNDKRKREYDKIVHMKNIPYTAGPTKQLGVLDIGIS